MQLMTLEEAARLTGCIRHEINILAKACPIRYHIRPGVVMADVSKLYRMRMKKIKRKIEGSI
jgi:hypothetical protein